MGIKEDIPHLQRSHSVIILKHTLLTSVSDRFGICPDCRSRGGHDQLLHIDSISRFMSPGRRLWKGYSMHRGNLCSLQAGPASPPDTSKRVNAPRRPSSSNSCFGKTGVLTAKTLKQSNPTYTCEEMARGVARGHCPRPSKSRWARSKQERAVGKCAWACEGCPLRDMNDREASSTVVL